jgi:hypothetical protein
MLKNDNISKASLFNLVQNESVATHNYTKKFLLSTEEIATTKDLRFKDYSSMLCNTHLSDETKIEFCFDTESDLFLTLIRATKDYYSHLSIYIMSDE